MRICTSCTQFTVTQTKIKSKKYEFCRSPQSLEARIPDFFCASKSYVQILLRFCKTCDKVS